MKVLDLHCPSGHVFEGWFGSEADYQSQRTQGLLQCPMCGSGDIHKSLSAPRLNLGASPARKAAASSDTSDATPATGQPGAPAALSATQHRQLRALQAAWLAASRQLAAQTENVGTRFVEEVRQMHRGEIEERPIRGQATVAQAQALWEEGVPVVPLALPADADTPLQ